MTYVYILRSISDPSQIYVGLTKDLRRRMVEHNSGKSNHTFRYKPWEVVYVEMFSTKLEALKREAQLKRWSRKKKDALIVGDLRRLKNS